MAPPEIPDLRDDEEDEETMIDSEVVPQYDAQPEVGQQTDSEPEPTELYSKEEVERSIREGLIDPLPDSASQLIEIADAGAEGVFADRYERLSWLGEGGMGEIVVYKDHHIGRDVALKTLHPEQSRAKVARERFIREARVQGQLEHPAIVPVYDAGKDDDGQLFFTMRRIHGVSLADALARIQAGDTEAAARFTRRRLLAAFNTVCLAVDMAHRRGVIHRDLKPENIMLGEFGEVHLLDWGLAKLQSEVSDPRDADRRITHDDDWRKVTQDGAVMGTLGYMSPEQLRGDSGLTFASDIYSLGAILFEICTLTPLNGGTGAAEVVASTLMGPEARPSVRCPERQVPYELEEIIVRAVKQDPLQRYTARALHDAVENILDTMRDVEHRRNRAEHHAQRARRHARKAPRDVDERRKSLREVWQSLALDADNRVAAQTMANLLMEVPEVMPPNVVANAGTDAPVTLMARRLTIGSYLAFAASIVVALSSGNPGWAALLLITITALLAVGTSVWLGRCLSSDLREARLRAELLNWHVYELMPTKKRG